jgi:hypothetical protein
MLKPGRFEVRALRRPIVVSIFLAAVAVACGNPHEPSDWSRSPGLLIPTLSSVQTIATPSHVRVGEAFMVTVNSMGSSTCVRGDGMDVVRHGNVVDLTPWDFVAPSNSVCTEDLRPYPHQTEITAQSTGTLTLRAHGVVYGEGGVRSLGTVITVVTVSP